MWNIIEILLFRFYLLQVSTKEFAVRFVAEQFHGYILDDCTTNLKCEYGVGKGDKK